MDYGKYLALPSNCRFHLEVVRTDFEDIQAGIRAAIELSKDKGIHPYTAYRAWQEVSVDWDDIEEAMVVTGEDYSSYYPLAVWADFWRELVSKAVLLAASSHPDGQVNYRMRVDWDSQKHSREELKWLSIYKRTVPGEGIPMGRRFVDAFPDSVHADPALLYRSAVPPAVQKGRPPQLDLGLEPTHYLSL